MSTKLLEVGTSHEPTIGSKGKGLWGIKGKQLPAVIQHTYNDMIEGGEAPGGHTYRLAVGTVRNWSHGHDGKGNKVNPDTVAKAQAAMREWDALRAEAHARSGKKDAKKDAKKATLAEDVNAVYDLAESRLSEMEVDNADAEDALPWLEVAQATAGPMRDPSRFARLWVAIGEDWSPQARAAAAEARRHHHPPRTAQVNLTPHVRALSVGSSIVAHAMEVHHESQGKFRVTRQGESPHETVRRPSLSTPGSRVARPGKNASGSSSSSMERGHVFGTPEAASAHLVRASLRSNHPASLGGKTRYDDVAHYERKHGRLGESSARARRRVDLQAMVRRIYQ